MKNIALFLKKNAVYILVAFCVLAVGLTILLVGISKGKKVEVQEPVQDIVVEDNYVNVPPVEDVVITPPSSTENETPVATTIVFAIPVSNFTSVEDYSEVPVFNSTLNRYSSHKGMDFFAPEGASVLAAYDGTVESVTNDILKGYTVIIDHGNGLKTTYNSLLDGDSVSAGQTVKKGDVIGEVSTSNRQEYKMGAHLHFEVSKDGVNVDPTAYLLNEDK